mmetsp:Transcript_37856/g.69192  ORF Transcript_37856/g.69192 Transcript_37856/m.69192 type:complete len:287 (+) Transcript_37856:407-1267(+)
MGTRPQVAPGRASSTNSPLVCVGWEEEEEEELIGLGVDVLEEEGGPRGSEQVEAPPPSLPASIPEGAPSVIAVAGCRASSAAPPTPPPPPIPRSLGSRSCSVDCGESTTICSKLPRGVCVVKRELMMPNVWSRRPSEPLYSPTTTASLQPRAAATANALSRSVVSWSSAWLRISDPRAWKCSKVSGVTLSKSPTTQSGTKVGWMSWRRLAAPSAQIRSIAKPQVSSTSLLSRGVFRRISARLHFFSRGNTLASQEGTLISAAHVAPPGDETAKDATVVKMLASNSC